MADIEVRTSGATVSASESDRIVIRLPENPSTGYQWSVAELGGPLEIVSNEYVMAGQIVPGAAGERVVVVRPRAPGSARLRLQLKRSWERDSVDRFDVGVDVAGA
ncbi:MAG TPA: protease inhibitor I42 family protein [Streptosporangiaceae bacterium]|jgi:inhibitor of cysteine peptidase